jgi:hypothetical protein
MIAAVNRTQIEIRIEEDWDRLPERFVRNAMHRHCRCSYDRAECGRDHILFFSDLGGSIRFGSVPPTYEDCRDRFYEKAIPEFEREVDKILARQRKNEPSIRDIRLVGKKLELILVQGGFGNLYTIATADPDDIVRSCSLSKKMATTLVRSARALLRMSPTNHGPLAEQRDTLS